MIVITFKSKPNRAFSYNGSVKDFFAKVEEAKENGMELFEYDSTLINYTDISTVKPYD